MDDLSIHVHLGFRWIPVEQEPGQAYRFPDEPTVTLRRTWKGRLAIYRWSVTMPADHEPRQFYIGETEELYRRLYHYRKPGPRQATNLRINALFRERIETGATVELHVLGIAQFRINDQDLSNSGLVRKEVRCSVERLLETHYRLAGFDMLSA